MSDQSIRVGLLGAGYIAEWHAAALARTPNVQMTAVCDAAESRAEALAKSIGASRWFGSLETMLSEDACDVVHVLLPPHLHFPLAKQVLEAGKSAFIEKPMCLEAEHCRALVETADANNVRVGCNHNFLCLPGYEQLHADVSKGRLGRLDHLTVDWMFPLGQIAGGPHDGWLFAEPQNVLFELAPHCFAFIEHLLGGMDVKHVQPSNPLTLPGGKTAWRRWQILGESSDGVGVDVRMSLVEGFPNRTLSVRGSGGRATFDLERDVYFSDRFNRHGIVFEPWVGARRVAKQIRREARRNLITQGKSLNKLAPFGLSITRSVGAFYATLNRADGVDERVDGATGASVIDLTQRVADAATFPSEAVAESEHDASAVTSTVNMEESPKVLVLGGSGFIGSYLVNALVDAGHKVRVVSRGQAPGLDRRGGAVEVMQASIGNPDDLKRMLEGIDVVYHLARAYAESWEDYLKNDVEVTRKVGEACVEAGVKRLIYTGTIDSYDAAKRNGQITEATGLDPDIESRNLYARSKALCETELLKLHRDKSLPLVIARPGIVIGAGGSPLHWGVGNWPAPTVCTLWGPGDVKLPLVLVEDVADALVRMLDAEGIEGDDFNIIGDPLLNAREYLSACEKAGGFEIQTHPTALWKYWAGDYTKYVVKKAVKHPGARKPSLKDWQSRSQRRGFDNSKLKSRLGWEPETDREQMVERGIAAPMRDLIR